MGQALLPEGARLGVGAQGSAGRGKHPGGRGPPEEPVPPARRLGSGPTMRPQVAFLGSFPQVISQGTCAGSAPLGPHLQSPSQQLLPRIHRADAVGPWRPTLQHGRHPRSPARPGNSRLPQGRCRLCHQLRVCSLLVSRISVFLSHFPFPIGASYTDSIFTTLRAGRDLSDQRRGEAAPLPEGHRRAVCVSVPWRRTQRPDRPGGLLRACSRPGWRSPGARLRVW